MNKLQKQYVKNYYQLICYEIKHPPSLHLNNRECERIAQKNRSIDNLSSENIRIEHHDNGIYLTLEEKIIAKILNRYSKRKINLCYKELKPEIIFI